MPRNIDYCTIMMQIADNRNNNVGIRQGALVQLKNTVRKHWTKDQDIAPE